MSCHQTLLLEWSWEVETGALIPPLPNEERLTRHKFGGFESSSSSADEFNEFKETTQETKEEREETSSFKFLECIEAGGEGNKQVTLQRALSVGPFLRVSKLRKRLVLYEHLLPPPLVEGAPELPNIVPVCIGDLRSHVRCCFDPKVLAVFYAMDNPPRPVQRLCHVFLVLLNGDPSTMMFRCWNSVRNLLHLKESSKRKLVSLTLSPHAQLTSKQQEWCERHLPEFTEHDEEEKKTPVYISKKALHLWCTAILNAGLVQGPKLRHFLPKMKKKKKKKKRKQPRLVDSAQEKNLIATKTFSFKQQDQTRARLLSDIPSCAIRGILRLREMTITVVRSKIHVIRKSIKRVLTTTSWNNARTKVCAVKYAAGAASGIDVHFAVEMNDVSTAVAGTLVSYIASPSFVGQLCTKAREQNFYVARSNVAITQVQSTRIHNLRLRLSWGFPRSSSRFDCDFLDGSALLYSKTKLLEIVDFRGSHSQLKKKI